MAKQESGKYVVKFHRPVEQPRKSDYLGIDVYRGDKFFGTLEVDDEGVEWWTDKGRRADRTWDSFIKKLQK